ncbi:hypothetical protein BKA61DRAFT_515722 [Leptodontidium sp. MPI-SDFR-AT-0119]|nr:hypothetical protein BKA61DRAFT_515722 [Leptodontidium sp. MPI-SDFR-AT-0119]
MPVWNPNWKPLSGPSRLVSLPVELQSGIIEALDARSKLALKITNRHFAALVKYPTHKELLATERTPWAESHSLYACMDCCRLRSSRKFADAMMKGPKGINGKEPHKRFCVDCGLNPKPRTTRYSPGAEITVGGKRHVICRDCRKYTSEVGCIGSGLCTGCHARIDCKCPPVLKLAAARRRAKVNRRRSRRREYDPWDDLDDCYDEHFWETND